MADPTSPLGRLESSTPYPGAPRFFKRGELGAVIYGFSTRSPHREDWRVEDDAWRSGSFPSECFSVLCPEGEYGFTPTHTIDEITQDAFFAAAQRGWRMSTEKLIDARDIAAAMAGIVQMPGRPSDYDRLALGLDSVALEEMAKIAGAEPFELHHGSGRHAVGTLYRIGGKLSAAEREAIRREIEDTAIAYFRTGMTLGRAIPGPEASPVEGR